MKTVIIAMIMQHATILIVHSTALVILALQEMEHTVKVTIYYCIHRNFCWRFFSFSFIKKAFLFDG